MAIDLLGLVTRQEGVGFVAHLAGEIAGILVAIALVARDWLPPERGERNLLEVWGWGNAKAQ
jgi:hypothetical protein